MVVFAAGNARSDGANYGPAGCDGAMAIAGTGPDNTRYTATNFGSGISVAAPAGAGSGFPATSQVLSTLNTGLTVQEDDAYAWYAGTSMAAPHVAGTAALMLEAADGNLTPVEMEEILRNTAYASNGLVANCDTSARWCGSLIDAGYAVAVAAGDEPLPPAPPGPPPPPPPTELENGVTVEIGEMAAGNEQFYTLEVPEGQGSLSFDMVPGTGASGDSDIYVRYGEAPTSGEYDCRPWTGGTVAENCSFTNPEAGTWHVRIEAYSASNGYNLTGTYDGDEPPPPPPPTQLDNGVTVGGIDVDAGEDLYYFIDVPEDATTLNVTMAGGTGDSDLYVRFGELPTDADYDCRPYLYGNDEACDFEAPAAGQWFIRINGYDPSAGISLTATHDGEGGGGGVGPENLAAQYVFPLRGQRIRVPLTWTGGEGEEVDVLFNGEVVATAANSGRYVHTFTAEALGPGSATYQVCNAGTDDCSGTITVNYSARR